MDQLNMYFYVDIQEYYTNMCVRVSVFLRRCLCASLLILLPYLLTLLIDPTYLTLPYLSHQQMPRAQNSIIYTKLDINRVADV